MTPEAAPASKMPDTAQTGGSGQAADWTGVAEACALVARQRGARTDPYAYFPAQALALAAMGRANLEAGPGDGMLRECFMTLEAVVRRRMHKVRMFNTAKIDGNHEAGCVAWRGLRSCMQQCGIAREAPAPGTAGWTDCAVRGGALGRVLAWFHEAGRMTDAFCVAEAVLGEGTRQHEECDLFAAAVGIPGAGVAATLGHLANVDHWSQHAAARPFTPTALAWLVRGLDLAMNAHGREAIENVDFWSPGAFDDVIEGAVRSVRGFDDGQVRDFWQAVEQAGAAVHTFNAGVRLLDDGTDGRGWSVSEAAQAGATKMAQAITLGLAMSHAERQLARPTQGGGRGGRRRA